MKDYKIARGLVRKTKTNTDDKFGHSLRQIQSDLNTILHVPFVDDCCPSTSTIVPTGFDSSDSLEKFYNPITKLWEVIPSGILTTPETLQTYSLATSDSNATEVVTIPVPASQMKRMEVQAFAMSVDGQSAFSYKQSIVFFKAIDYSFFASPFVIIEPKEYLGINLSPLDVIVVGSPAGSIYITVIGHPAQQVNWTIHIKSIANT